MSDSIIFVEYVEIYKFVFFEGEIRFSICLELTGEKWNELDVEIMFR